ncbi:MAG: asparaginase [Rhodothermaeota bacterium MED-G64]|nr:MAG: asparaginase [Rhodothermaeota bacterium MED-G64]RPF79888.1 MAG: asparaginase [Rhodothermaceae bacterium TMED105]HBD42940.1 asparaginase [Bacteroidota bacterium]
MKHIHLIQTGGTIAMDVKDGEMFWDDERFKASFDRAFPELEDIAHITHESLFREDSSDLHPTNWIALAHAIRSAAGTCDGVVVLHGTDTMAFTASALSYTLSDLSIPIILTGSQVPLSVLRSDARRNLMNAVELATYPIAEVMIAFNDCLYRGNRTTKLSINEFNAFSSPNEALLAKIGMSIQFQQEYKGLRNSQKEPAKRPFQDPSTRFGLNFSPESLSIFPLFPGWKPQLNLPQELDPMNTKQVVILEAYGSGNVPTKGPTSVLPFVEQLRAQGNHVIVRSQALYDTVQLSAYESGRQLEALGVVSAGDMTYESTITKAMLCVAHTSSQEEFKSLFETPYCGDR